ncbi:MAG: leucine-rich repeat protein [Eubacteriales bacterium]|nr:leucine-rich repeat protein [Eubacteriales bacterium]
MKRFLSIILTFAMMASLLCGISVAAESIVIDVVADEGWENATYDEGTGILTNVTDGYSFMLLGDEIGPVANQNITASKVVIPSIVKTSGGDIHIKTVSSGILAGVAYTSTSSTVKNEAVTEVIVSEGITTINKYAFFNSTALTTLNLPSTLTKVNEYGFSNSGIVNIDLPDSLTYYGKGAFYNCTKLTEIEIPEGTINFSNTEVFRNCTSLTSIKLPSTMTDTNSGGSTFRGCKALTSIEFPANLAYIRKNDFLECSNLTNVVFTQLTAPTVDTSAFSKAGVLTVTCPGEGDGYDAAWKAKLPATSTFVFTKGSPKAYTPVLNGLNLVGDTLSTTYTYFDPENREESGSTTVWESSTVADFSANVTTIKTEACSAAAPSTYTIVTADNGKYIRATITPRNAGVDYNEGKPASVQLTDAVRIPVTAPTVTITSPINNGQEIAINKEFKLAATAVCDNTTITKVEFYVNDNLVGESTAAPYQVMWTPSEMGDYSITSKGYNALGEVTTSAVTTLKVLDRVPIFSLTTSGPDNWGTFNGTSAAKVEGAGEDGKTAWVLTGGSNGGGANFSLNVGGFVASTITHKDPDGNTIGKTKGFVDASEFFLRYNSQSGFKIKLILEFRASKKPTLSTNTVSIPSSNGEWATYKFKMSDFATGTELEDLWWQNIYGAYTSNFEPVVLMKIEGLNQGDSKSMTLDTIGVNWYEDEMVTKIEWAEQPKKEYFQYYDNFDYETGKLNVYRGNATEPSEVVSLNDPRVTVSGFSNKTIKDSTTESKNMKMTVTFLNNSEIYYAKVLPFAPETLTEIQVNEPKTSYFVGDPFDYATGLIQATYSDKDPEFAKLDDPNSVITGFDTATAGEKTVTVTYGARIYSYTINVQEFSVPGITSITVNKPRRVYSVGEAFNYHDGNISPYKNGMIQPSIKLYDRYAKIEGFDSSSPAQDQVITVSYSGVSTTYTIDIIAGPAPALYYSEMNFADGNRPSIWYSSGGATSFVAGAGEDGVSTGWQLTGSGTHQTALTGGWAGGNSTSNIGTTVNGLKGADAISIRYKSSGSGAIQFKLDYRASDKATLSSSNIAFPSTGNIWKTVTIPIADFAPTPTGESFDQQMDSVDWVYNNIIGGYTTDFEPVVMMFFKSSNGTDQATIVDNIRAVWYDNYSGVESLTLNPTNTTIYEGTDFNIKGSATVNYKDGTSRTADISDLDIKFSGFNPNAGPGSQTVTAVYGGKETSFNVQVLEGGDDVISSVLSEDVRKVYLVGEEFDRTAGTITLTKANGTQEVIALSDSAVTISGFDSSVQSTNVPVTITYKDITIPLQARVFNPYTSYSAPAFTDGDGIAISSFDGVATVKATIKARNRIACPSPQTACVIAVVYGDNNTVKLIKQLDNSVLPASTELTLTAEFTAEELANAKSIKIIALKDSLSIENLVNPASISK